MQVTCNRDELREALHIVQRAISSRTTLPILNNVLLEASEGTLVLTATDLEMTMRASLAAQVSEAGCTTAPVRYLAPMVDSLPLEEASLGADARDQLTLAAGTTNYVINGMSADEFPVVPTVEDAEELALPQGMLKEMIEQVHFAASSDESRAILTGVLLELEEGSIRLVATDTHRLAVREEPHTLELSEAKQAIIPVKALREVNRLLQRNSEDPVKLGFSENQVRFAIDDTLIMCRLLEGSYPNWRRVIPTEFEREVTLNKEELSAAVNRVMIVAREAGGRLRFDIKPERVQVYAHSQDVGEAREELVGKLTGEGLEVAFKGDFLVDAMNALDTEEMVIKLNAPLAPAVITTLSGENYTYVVMPMQA